MKNSLADQPGVHKTVLKVKLIWASGWQGWTEKEGLRQICRQPSFSFINYPYTLPNPEKLAVRIPRINRHGDIFHAGYTRLSCIFLCYFFMLRDVENLVQINFLDPALEQRNPMVTDCS